METIIKIKPISFSLDTLEIFNVSLQLDKTATITCRVVGKELSISHQIELTQEEYDGWGNDDTYIKKLVLGKLQLVEA